MAKRIAFWFCLFLSFALQAENYPKGQLSGDVTPSFYTLSLNVDPSQDSFTGKAEIEINISKSLKRFWMHGDDLEVSSVVLETAGNHSFSGKYEQVSTDGVSRVTFDRRVPAGKAKLILTYKAALKNSLNGMYKVIANKQAYAFTQFEPIAARKCFPSFDEPRFKTPFAVELQVLKNDVAIANTPIVSETIIDENFKRVKFKTSKPMPTYLVAFAVGPFDIVEVKPLASNSVRKNTVAFRGVAVKGMGKKLGYAMQHTPGIVQKLEEYFQTPYPYEKLDIIAVPDFAAGAMENVGAITFRERYLIIDRKTAPESQKRDFANIMAHELAHQWFGNLVTMAWWDDLWLNESFATWMSYRLVEDLYPQYNSQVSMLAWIHSAMRDDSLVSARQIKQPIKSYHDIHNAFDSITYAKGASVLSMFENYLGEEVFRKSVQYHLKKFEFKTATAEDFIDSLSRVSKKDLRHTFQSYISKPGIPWLETDLENNENALELSLKQSRFLPVGSKGQKNKTWSIPFCYKYGTKGKTSKECRLVEQSNLTLKATSKRADWFVANANASGYYQWILSQDKLADLSTNHLDKLNEREQFDLINNIQSAFKGGRLSAESVLDLLPLYTAKQARLVSTSPSKLLNWVKNYAVTSENLPAFRNYVAKLYLPIYHELKEGKTSKLSVAEQELFMVSVQDILANIAYDKTVRRGLIQHGGGFIAGLVNRQPSGSTELANVSVPVWVEETPGAVLILTKLLSETTDPMMRAILIKGIGKGANLKDAPVVFGLLTSKELRVFEVMRLYQAFMSSPDKRELGWKWFKENYQVLSKALPESKRASFPYLAYRFCSQKKESEVQAFFKGKVEDYPGGPRVLKEVLENISLCTSLVKRQQKPLEAFLLKTNVTNTVG